MSQKKEQPEKLYSLIKISALTGQVTAEGLAPWRVHVTTYKPLTDALLSLAEGGYVVDLGSIADHPHLGSLVHLAPMPNNYIEGEEISRLSGGARVSATYMMAGVVGEFQEHAVRMAYSVGEPEDGSAGPYDKVSAAVYARYWQQHGARIGRRVGNMLEWSDGQTQPIETAKRKDAA